MKRIIYISLVAVGFLMVSCTKEKFQPCTKNTEEAPVWRASSAGDVETDTGVGTGTIIDPNNDPDENSRRRH